MPSTKSQSRLSKQRTQKAGHSSKTPEVSPATRPPSHLQPAMSEPTSAGSNRLSHQRWAAVIASLGSLALCLVIYLLRLDRVVGLYSDDAWYVLLAKALATGHGYTLINSPSPGITPLYPPAFAWLLSLVFRVAPDFPQNVWLLKSVSIAAMLGVGVAAYYYFARVRKLPFYLSLGLATAIVIHPAFTFLAASTVMSECVFTLAQLLTVVVIERVVSAGRHELAWRYTLLGAALASAAFLTRSAGAALIVAVMIYLLKERLTRAAAIFALGVAVLVGPWMIYTRMHAPTAAQQAEQNNYIVDGYATAFWQARASYSGLGTISLSDLPERVLNNTFHMLEYDAGALLVYPVYRAVEPVEGKPREVQTALLSFILCLLIITGFVAAVRERLGLAELVVPLSLVLTVIWPFWPFRFILPLLPWAMLYALFGVRAIFRLGTRLLRHHQPRSSWAMLGGAAACLAAISLYGNLTYILSLHGPESERPRWVRAYDENVALYQWLDKHTAPQSVIAAQNPALLHLFTGHKTIGSWEPGKNWEYWKQLGVRYLVSTSSSPVDEPNWAERRYPIVYQSDWLKLRVLDFGEAQSRRIWIDNP